MSEKYDRNTPMKINLEQQKTISSPLRSRIIALLYEKTMTSKQVAELLEKNPGTIYYHIQQLYKNDILEIEKTEVNKGVVEKYYSAKAIAFSIDGEEDYIAKKYTNIYLSDTLLEKLNNEILDLLLKYGHLSFEEKDSEKQKEYLVEYGIKAYKEGEDNEKN